MGPVIGGFLTTNYLGAGRSVSTSSSLVTIIGALVFMKPGTQSARRPRIDAVGAMLIASGMFLLVFGLSEGSTYGWWKPLQAFTVGGTTIWPAPAPVSISAVAIIAAAILTTFVFYERAKELRHGDPLFEFVHLRHRTYRYGLLTGLVLAMGQLGLSFALPLFLQDAKHLTAAQNGLSAARRVVHHRGAQVGGRLIRTTGTTVVVRLGLAPYLLGLFLMFQAITLDITWWKLLPASPATASGSGSRRTAHQRGAVRDPAESSGWRAARTRPCAKSAARSASR
jgi:hypothetical protein